jgi:hypothetical protein
MSFVVPMTIKVIVAAAVVAAANFHEPRNCEWKTRETG